MTILQDILGLITKRKIKTPSDNDYIVSAAYTNTQERLKPQPKMEANLINIGELKKYIGGSGTSNLESITIDSNIGSRLKPTDPLINGFYVNRNVNGVVGYLALNTNTGNAAVAAHGVSIDSDSYVKNVVLAKFGPNYFVSLLAGKGGLLGTEEVFVGSTNGEDVSVLTGASYAALTRKFTVKANGQLLMQTPPTILQSGDYWGSSQLLVRDSDAQIKALGISNVEAFKAFPSNSLFATFFNDGILASAVKSSFYGIITANWNDPYFTVNFPYVEYFYTSCSIRLSFIGTGYPKEIVCTLVSVTPNALNFIIRDISSGTLINSTNYTSFLGYGNLKVDQY